MASIAVAAVAVPAFMFQAPAPPATAAMFAANSMPAYSVLHMPAGIGGDDRSDELPHMPEAPPTLWPGYYGAAATVSTNRVSPSGIVFYGQPGATVPIYPSNWT